MKSRKFKIIGISAIILVALFIVIRITKKDHPRFTIQTVKIEKGSVDNSVTATGTIQAIKTVAVGTQVSGVINKLYVDFNSQVKKGQLLAEIDTTPLVAALDNAKASLEAAQAAVTYQTANYKRVKALHDKKLVAEADYDQAMYNYVSARTSYTMAKSNYDKAKINLSYAFIYSPINGVVLNRAVDEGQTVAASFNTPTLFSIANDLTQMEVAADVDEADIGQIRDGQKVEFTVDAYPDRNFTGEVTQIRLQPTTTSNVVTYTVIVKAPNPDKTLMPGMTASITIIIQKSDHTLIVPGRALRFTPDANMLMVYMKTLPEPLQQKMARRIPFSTMMHQTHKLNLTGETTPSDVVWVKSGQEIYPDTLKLGIDDGINAEVKSGINEGDEVIVNMSSTIKNVAKAAEQSPFMPHRPGKK